MSGARVSVAGLLLLATPHVYAITSFSDPDELRPINSFNPMVKLEVQRPEGTALCSGALIDGGSHVMTAAHCLADGMGNPVATSIDVSFGDGPMTMSTSNYLYPSEWNGDWRTSGADIAIVQLPTSPPGGAGSLVLPGSGTINPPLTVRVGGYGAWGQGGIDPGYLSGSDPHLARIGGNHYDRPPPKTPAFLAANYNFIDFDDYTPGSNFTGEPGWITLPSGMRSIPMVDYPRDGAGVPAEAFAAPGDSGGPTFADNVLLGIHAWGATTASTGELAFDALLPLLVLGDPPGFDAGFGNVVGDVIVANYTDWARDAIAAGEYFDLTGIGDGPQSGSVPLVPSLLLLLGGLAGLGCARYRSPKAFSCGAPGPG